MARRPPSVVATLLVLLAGCSLLGEDYSDLESGTFRLRGNGEEVTGEAFYEPAEDNPLRQASVLLAEGDDVRLQIETEELLTAEAGDELTPGAGFYPESGGTYARQSGTLRVTAVEAGRLAGTFRFRMKDISPGCLFCSEITVTGGFNALEISTS